MTTSGRQDPAQVGGEPTLVAGEARPEAERKYSYVRDYILGAIDGCVTTFAVVSGAAGAALPSGVVVVLGAANLLADGVSMAVSNHQGISAERQVRQLDRRAVELQLETHPEVSREEVRQIYAGKGLADDDVEQLVRIITSDRKLWIETILEQTKGGASSGRSPWQAAIATFVSFVAVGLVPLVVFIYDLVAPRPVVNPFTWSAFLAFAAFFMVGALKSSFTKQPWYRAGLETLAAGGAAAILAYLVGYVLSRLFGVMR